VQSWVARLRHRRSATFVLALAFAGQSALSTAAFDSLTVTGTTPGASSDSAKASTPRNPDLPLEGPADPLASAVDSTTLAAPNDPHAERGEVRPPQPEPAGTIVDARSSRNTRTTSKGEGRYETTTSSESINYQDSDGHWRPIDLTLVPAMPGSEFAHRTKANDRVVELADRTQAHLARIAGGSDELLVGSPNLMGSDQAELHGAGLRYGTGPMTVELTPTPDGLHLGATFTNSAAPVSVGFTVEAGDLVMRELPDGSISFRDEEADRMPFLIDAPVIVDAAGERVTNIEVDVQRAGPPDDTSRITIRYSIRRDQAEALHFPLSLDPTITLWPLATSATIRVVDGATGLPVSGVQVTDYTPPPGSGQTSINCLPYPTDATGTCTLSGINPDLAVPVTTTKAGYWQKVTMLTVTPGTVQTITIWSTSSAVVVKVADGRTGLPVAGALVTDPTPPPGGGTSSINCLPYPTDATGVCSVTGINPDLRVPLSISKSGYFSRSSTVTPAPGATHAEVIWPTDTSAILTVVDAVARLPIAGVALGGVTTDPASCPIHVETVYDWYYDGVNPPVLRGIYTYNTPTTGPDGTCTIIGFNPDLPTRLDVGTSAISGPIWSPNSNYLSKALDQRLAPGTMTVGIWPTSTSRSIKLVDAQSGVPIPGVTVTMGSPTNGSVNCPGSTTASDGTCTISGIDPDRSVTVSLARSSYFTKTVTFTPSTGAFTIALWGGATAADARNAAVGLSSAGTYYPDTSTTLTLGGNLPWYRAYLTFAPPGLPDGGQVYKATLGLYKTTTTGADPVEVVATTSSWSPGSITLGSQPGAGDVLATMVPLSSTGTVSADVTSWAKTAYTRNLSAAQPQWGFLLRSAREGQTSSSSWAIAGNGYSTASVRPTLTVEYRVVSGTIGFASALGPNFQPSTMLVGRTTTLPVVVTNTSGYTWQTGGSDKIAVGYRWLDGNGDLLNIPDFTPYGATDLPGATVGSNASVSVTLPVRAPPITTNARLRLDLLTARDGSVLYFSDSSLPALYWAPAKPAGVDSGYASYSGLSVVGKAEYPVDVAEDVSTMPVGTTLAEGGRVSIDAFSGNLTYSSSDLTVPDRGPDLSIGRTYNSATISTCDGILRSCGWSTNADERITQPLSANPIYQDASGRRHAGLVDHVGQIMWAGAAGVDLTHRRVTLLDDVVRSGWTGTTPSIVTSPIASGEYAYQLPDGATATLTGLAIRLNTYPQIGWQTRTTSANSSAVVFTLVDNAGQTRTIAYVHGTPFSTGANIVVADSQGSTVGAFVATTHNVYADALAADPTLGRELTLTGLMLKAAAGAGATTFDALAMTPSTTTLVADANPTWTTGSAVTETSDVYAGSASLQLSSGTASQNLSNVSLAETPFLTWAWKKGAGTGLALQVTVTDLSTNDRRTITYFAGASSYNPPGDAGIAAGSGLPVGWTRVTRNVLDDARNVFKAYADPVGVRSDTSQTRFGPHGDFFRLDAWSVIDGDSLPALFDSVMLGSAPSVASGDTGHEWATVRGDGTTAYFNEGGRLAQLVDPSGNSQSYRWTYSPTSDTWRLDQISEDYDANRALRFTYPSPGVTTVTDVIGRTVTYTVSGSDLVSVRGFRGGTTAYVYGANHRLTAVRDPRYTAQNDFQTAIEYDASGLATTVYDGAQPTGRQVTKVLNRTSSIVAGLMGVHFRTAQQLAASSSQLIEFDPNGAIVNEYAPKSGTTLPTSADVRTKYTNDGLSQSSTTIRYRTVGQQDPLIDRRGSNAEAVLNAFKRATDAARINWTQSPSEYNASTDQAKLAYRTLVAYDANNDVVGGTDAIGHAFYQAYDAARRPTYADDNFVANSHFTSDLTSWTSANGPTWSNTSGNESGFWNGGANVGATATLTQTVTLAAGTTFHLQADGRNGISVALTYHKSTGWTSLGSLGPIGTSTYATAAATFTVPLDSDTGQVQLKITGASGGAVDNVVLRSSARTFTYDPFGNPVTSRDLLGRVSHTFYEADPAGAFAAGVYATRTVENEVAGGVAPDQNVMTGVTQNAVGLILSSTDPIGRTATMTYAPNGVDVASITDPTGGKTTYTYDVGGRVTTLVSANGNAAGANPTDYRTTKVYDAFGRLSDVTDPMGIASHTDYDVAGHPIATYQNYTDGTTLSGLANVKAVTVYDADGRTSSTTVDAGAGNLALTSSATYDLQGNALSSTDPAGRVTTTYYDAAGRAAAVREPITATGAPAPPCPGSSTVFCNTYRTFDLLGRPVTETDAAGHVTATRYDINGQPVALTDARGNTTSARYDLRGQTVATTDQLGGVTTTTYDGLDRPTVVTAADTSFRKSVYDAAGQVTDSSAPAVAGTPDGSLVWTHTQYDPAGRALTTTAHYVAGGASTADQNVVTSTTTYDAEGHIVTTTGTPGTVGGTALAVKSTYDRLGRRTSVITNYVSGGPVDDQTNMTTSYTYDALARLVMETDPAGVMTKSFYDRAGRLTTVTQNYLAGQPSSATANVTSVYGYNDAGELTSYCPPETGRAGDCLQRSWAYGRDGFGNVNLQRAPSDASLGLITATFDAAGRLASSFDGLHTQTYSYDETNNVQQITASGGSAPPVTYTYTYDAGNRRTSASNGTDTLTFEYDALHRLTAVKRAGVTISGATYNPDGTVATSIQSAGTATFTYDGLSRLATASMPSLFSGTATFTWRPDGLLGARSWPAGTTETFSYDAAKRPSELSVKKADNTILATFTSTFDRVGNLVSESQVIPGKTGLAGGSTITLTNDPLRRVTSYTSSTPGATSLGAGALDPGISHAWAVDALDAAGNRSARTPTVNTAPALPSGTQSMTLRPASDVASSGFTPNSGTTKYTQLDEATNDADTTYIYGPASGTASITLGMGTTAGPVYAATIHYTARQYVSAGQPSTMNVHAELYDGATLVGVGATHNLPTSYTAYADTFGTVAISSAASLRVRLVQDSAGTNKITSRFTYLDVVATYLPVVDTSAPTAPTNLVAAASASPSPARSRASLSWTAATDNTAVARYEISRGGVRIAEVPASATSYVDDAVVPNTGYSYTVAAIDAAFNRSSASATASVTTPVYAGSSSDATPPSAPAGLSVTPASPTSVTLAWTASSDDIGVDAYGIYRDNVLVAVLPTNTTNTVAYTYDADSNRLSAGATTFTYNRADQLMSQTKGGVTRAATYDAAGNLLSSPVSDATNSTFTYSATNKPLTEVVAGQPTVTFTYDALDRRASRSDGTLTETYAYVGTGPTIGRIDRGGGQLIDSAIDPLGNRLTVGGAWTIPTVRGDVAALLNAAGTSVTDAYRYDPFGVTLASLGTSANPYRFGGRLLEPTSGQYDFGARQYDPALAAFTSLDTVLGRVVDPLSLNRYLYALANPESMIDPDGHAACRVADDCAEIAATSKLAALTAAAAAADAAAGSAFRVAERADAADSRARAALNQPCRYGEPDWCATWRHSLAAVAGRAEQAARTAWANYAAAQQRATAAHAAVARAAQQLAAIRKRGSASSGTVRYGTGSLGAAIGAGSKGVYANSRVNQYQLYGGNGGAYGGSSVARIQDLSKGRPGKGEWVVRVDPADSRGNPPHINVNPAALGVADPHVGVPSGVVRAAGGFATAVEGAQRVALPVAVVTDAWYLYAAYEADEGTIGPQTTHTALSIAGGWAGAGVGAWAGGGAGGAVGAAVGSAVPVVGTVIGGATGAVVGGLVGGIIGGIAGSGLGDAFFEWTR
jgi:RHS repeat-associated protein